MAHGGQEIALGPVGGFGGFQRLGLGFGRAAGLRHIDKGGDAIAPGAVAVGNGVDVHPHVGEASVGGAYTRLEWRQHAVGTAGVQAAAQTRHEVGAEMPAGKALVEVGHAEQPRRRRIGAVQLDPIEHALQRGRAVLQGVAPLLVVLGVADQVMQGRGVEEHLRQGALVEHHPPQSRGLANLVLGLGQMFASADHPRHALAGEAERQHQDQRQRYDRLVQRVGGQQHEGHHGHAGQGRR